MVGCPSCHCGLLRDRTGHLAQVPHATNHPARAAPWKSELATQKYAINRTSSYLPSLQYLFCIATFFFIVTLATNSSYIAIFLFKQHTVSNKWTRLRDQLEDSTDSVSSCAQSACELVCGSRIPIYFGFKQLYSGAASRIYCGHNCARTVLLKAASCTDNLTLCSINQSRLALRCIPIPVYCNRLAGATFPHQPDEAGRCHTRVHCKWWQRWDFGASTTSCDRVWK